MLKAIGSFVGVATLIATILTLIGYLLSRDTSVGTFFDQNWELILSASGLVILGMIVAGAGVGILYSAEGAFSALTVPAGLAVVAGGGFLVYLGVAVILNMGPGNESTAVIFTAM